MKGNAATAATKLVKDNLKLSFMGIPLGLMKNISEL